MGTGYPRRNEHTAIEPVLKADLVTILSKSFSVGVSNSHVNVTGATTDARILLMSP